MKKRCAQKALAYIQDGMVIGLGGGSTIAHLARFVKESGKQVQIVTPSLETETLCIKLGLRFFRCARYPMWISPLTAVMKQTVNFMR